MYDWAPARPPEPEWTPKDAREIAALAGKLEAAMAGEGNNMTMKERKRFDELCRQYEAHLQWEHNENQRAAI